MNKNRDQYKLYLKQIKEYLILFKIINNNNLTIDELIKLYFKVRYNEDINNIKDHRTFLRKRFKEERNNIPSDLANFI